MRKEKITIYTKGGYIYAKGNMSVKNCNLGASLLRRGAVEPTAQTKIKRTVHKFFRAVKYATAGTAPGRRYKNKGGLRAH